MTERQALLASVIAHPAEDVPRLAYADCVEAEPDRAEFIRVQCRIAAMCEAHRRGEPLHPEFDAVRPREMALWPAAAHPIQRLADAMGGTENDCLIRRGFLEAVTCPAAWWLAHADAILAAHPVQDVRLTTTPDIETIDRPGWQGGHTREFSVRSPGRHRASVAVSWHQLDRRDAAFDRAAAEAARATEQVVRVFLEANWPAVKAWHLPPARVEANAFTRPPWPAALATEQVMDDVRRAREARRRHFEGMARGTPPS